MNKAAQNRFMSVLGQWIVMILCGFLPLGLAVVPMVLQILGVWSY
jgi:hypothetical protein